MSAAAPRVEIMLRQTIGTLVLSCWATVAAGQDFSIENKVFAGRELVASSTTLLVGNQAFDFLVRPDETIILALDTGTIDLLDNARKIRARVTAEELAAFNDALKQKAERSGSEAMQFYAAPVFREELDPETREIVLSSTWLEYRAKPTSPPNADVLRRYEKYVSQQAQLNTLVNPGAPPALPRLELNAALARRQMLAEQVSMRRTTSLSPGSPNTLRAEHRFTWRLDEPDHRRIEEAEQRLVSYRLVSVGEYVRLLVESARR
jgi:hypothetical protein